MKFARRCLFRPTIHSPFFIWSKIPRASQFLRYNFDMKLNGIFPPLTTPFDVDGALDLTSFGQNIARYNQTGVAGYVVNGSTGEAPLLRWNEVFKLCQAARQAAGPGKLVIAGTAAESTAETIEHTNRAAALGCDVAMVRTPHYYKTSMSEDALAEYYFRVAEAAGIPIMVYSIPIFTGVTVEASLLKRLATHPNIVGIKDSSRSVSRVAEFRKVVPESFQILVGNANTFYEALQMGACGGVLGLADIFPEECVEILEAHAQGDAARAAALQQRMVPISDEVLNPYSIAGLKYAMDLLGYYGGVPRSPILPVSDTAKRAIESALAPFGVPGVQAVSPHHAN
jgi:4-hydroxy-2-oxoglutarate aldolase